jgi:hypothetical protein
MAPTRRAVRVPQLAATLAVVAWCAAPAAASHLITRDATDVRLQVGGDGKALVSYHARGVARHVLAWGAINARPSESGRPQVEFRVDYSGGPSFANACVPARPPLAWLVTACRAPDGSYWAVQSWPRTLPNYGAPARPGRGSRELRLSHWSGPLPRLDIHFGWAYSRFQQIYGRLTYRGLPVYGFRSTRAGVPLDGYGRNIYVDTLDSAYGKGWHRENSFLTHRPTGGFCYGFYPHGSYPSGHGKRYRATVMGPGVTPDAYWEGTPPQRYNRQFDLRADDHMRAMLAGDPTCRPR